MRRGASFQEVSDGQARFNDIPLQYNPDPHPRRHIDICGTGSDEQYRNRQYPRTGTEGLQGDTGEAGEADG